VLRLPAVQPQVSAAISDEFKELLSVQIRFVPTLLHILYNIQVTATGFG
jgi:hypothetical protein